MKKQKNIKNLSHSIVFLAISLILGYVEMIIPINVGYVGVKLGLCNIISILGLKILDNKSILIINILRLIIIGILFGNLIRFVISLAGFIFSYIVLFFFLEILRFSIVTSSCFAGVFHNLGQIFAISFLLKNINVVMIIPIYIFFGIASGIIVGILSYLIYKKLSVLLD